MDAVLLAIDAGTGSGRAVIFDAAGHQLGVGQEEWVHIAEPNVPNSMSFDCKNNWELICRCIKKAIQQAGVSPSQIQAVSSTSMREGIVLYNESNQPIWAVANVDARASEEVKELHQQFPGMEEAFYQVSGQTFALGALPRLLWLKKHHPETFAQVRHINMISDWVLTELSGKIVSEPSNAGTAGIFSLKDRSWFPHLVKALDIPPSIFPDTFETGTQVGEVSAQAAKQTGLLAGTPVITGGGDVQLGSAGLGVVELGESAVLGGTFWQQIVNIPADTAVPKDLSIRVNPHVIPGVSQAEGITFFSGLVMRWFRDAFCDLEVMQAQEQGVDAYTLLEQKAQKVPVGSYGILPVFSDAMNYGHWMHASPSFINLSLDAEKCNKASMFRALQENACIVSAINLKNIEAFSGISSEQLVFAGGASKGLLWPQILADVTGKTIHIPEVKEATALGAAMAAGTGIGIYNSMAQASREIVRWEKTVEPNLEHTQRYADITEKWQAVYQAQLDLVKSGLTEPMWKAPGL
ncbi:autoinducer-2 kinase [Hydrogenovibrio marinus]|uniref:Autoinducer kinase n=1 Tax=Hydrogenovibrio marinus TaxID=28885 RepID=A0A067A172_HYDMR|nr:autoinducer-2 kinase [Hydrogenovibrio marinus]KDN96366.1 autoinducer kinase [Hydrogenovibrio marinus]BBN60440.1 autoinducer-2 kinase [Hydrogenovibrio marinus]